MISSIKTTQNTAMTLNDAQIQASMHSLKGWTLEANTHAMTKTWNLSSFDEAVTLFNQIVQLSKDLDHHPEVWSSYTQLRVRLWTHDAAGLTDKDFKLAQAIDQLSTIR